MTDFKDLQRRFLAAEIALLQNKGALPLPDAELFEFVAQTGDASDLARRFLEVLTAIHGVIEQIPPAPMAYLTIQRLKPLTQSPALSCRHGLQISLRSVGKRRVLRSILRGFLAERLSDS